MDALGLLVHPAVQSLIPDGSPTDARSFGVRCARVPVTKTPTSLGSASLPAYCRTGDGRYRRWFTLRDCATIFGFSVRRGPLPTALHLTHDLHGCRECFLGRAAVTQASPGRLLSACLNLDLQLRYRGREPLDSGRAQPRCFASFHTAFPYPANPTPGRASTKPWGGQRTIHCSVLGPTTMDPDPNLHQANRASCTTHTHTRGPASSSESPIPTSPNAHFWFTRPLTNHNRHRLH